MLSEPNNPKSLCTILGYLRIALFLLAVPHVIFAADQRWPIDLKKVLRQDGVGFPKTWGTNGGVLIVADYEMDAEVVNDPAYQQEMIAALRALPSLTLTLDAADLFGGKDGIYAHPTESGDAWERRCSVSF